MKLLLDTSVLVAGLNPRHFERLVASVRILTPAE